MAVPKFLADVMVGKLARWLRVLGFDVAYSHRHEDNEIIRAAAADGRVILTRDVRLVQKKSVNGLLIESGDYREQVRQVLQTFDLKTFDVFSRCLECNRALEPIDKEMARDRVPPYVHQTQEHFAVCNTCGRIFWHGTHARRILDQIEGF